MSEGSTSHDHAMESASMPLSPREMLLARVGSISVPVTVQLCQRRMTLDEFLALRPGSFIPFSTRCDEPLKLRVDGATIALGEPVQNGSQLGLRLSRFVEQSVRW